MSFPIEGKCRSTCRREPAFSDMPTAIGLGFSLQTSSIRRCTMEFACVISSDLVFSVTQFLVFSAALKFRFTNSMYFSLLLVLINGSIPRTFALRATCVLSLSRGAKSFARPAPASSSSSSLLGYLRSTVEEKGMYSLCFWPPGSSLSMSTPFPWIFISSNECTLNVSTIKGKKAFDATHLGMGHN